jgi:phage baseplate assembly protein W
MNLDFLGRGWSFPPTFDQAIAGVEMLEQEVDVASSLHILLTTAQGERIMAPEYGCNLDELLFESLDTRTKTLMTDKIEAAIVYFEPRIELESVRLYDSGDDYEELKRVRLNESGELKRVRLDSSRDLEGVVLIEIIYRIISTNTRYNFVFPYYGQEGTDLNLPVTLRVLPED